MASESHQPIEDRLFVGIRGSVRQVAYSLDGFLIEVFEEPIRRVDSNSVRLSILLDVIRRELEEVDALAFDIDRVPEAVAVSTRQ